MALTKVKSGRVFDVTYYEVACMKSFKGYEKDNIYTIHIDKMDKRFAVYKSLAHFREDPGYTVFNSVDEIWNYFLEKSKMVKEIKE